MVGRIQDWIKSQFGYQMDCHKTVTSNYAEKESDTSKNPQEKSDIESTGKKKDIPFKEMQKKIETVRALLQQDVPCTEYSENTNKAARAAYRNPNTEVIKTTLENILKDPNATNDEVTLAKLGLVAFSDTVKNTAKNLKTNPALIMARTVTESIAKCICGPVGVVISQLAGNVMGDKVNSLDKAHSEIQKTILETAFQMMENNPRVTDETKALAREGLAIASEPGKYNVYLPTKQTIEALKGKLSDDKLAVLAEVFELDRGNTMLPVSEERLKTIMKKGTFSILDSSVIEHLKGKIPEKRLNEFAGKISGQQIYVSNEHLDETMMKTYKFNEKERKIISDNVIRPTFTDDELALIIHNSYDATDYNKAKNMKSVAEKIVSTGIKIQDKADETKCNEVIGEVNRVMNLFKTESKVTKASGSDKNSARIYLDSKVSEWEDRTQYISGSLEYNKETGKTVNMAASVKILNQDALEFEGTPSYVSRQESKFIQNAHEIKYNDSTDFSRNDGFELYGVVSYSRENRLILDSTAMKKLEGKVRTESLKRFEGKELSTTDFRNLLEGHKASFTRREVDVIMNNMTPLGLCEDYSLTTSVEYNEEVTHHVIVYDDGKKTYKKEVRSTQAFT